MIQVKDVIKMMEIFIEVRDELSSIVRHTDKINTIIDSMDKVIKESHEKE